MIIRLSGKTGTQRAALLEGDLLREFWVHDPARPDGVGDVYTGRVDAILPALAGRFLDLGGTAGFLPDSAGGKTLSMGTYTSVQVTRSPQGGKGPRLAVLDEPPGTATGLRRRGGGPLLDLCARYPDCEILVDDYALTATLRSSIAGRLRHDAAAFDDVLEDEIAALFSPRAALPHGALMHITPAPAATLIDIDAATASAMPPLALNLALIPELCRQIRARNLSGGIMIDFAGLKQSARAKLAGPLRTTLAADPLRPECLGMSHLGFAEITRRRIRPPLHESLLA